MPVTRGPGRRLCRSNDSTIQRFNSSSIEICILAGGLSQRMGRDKSQLRFGSTTMLGHIRKIAQATGFPVRIIRRDCVPKCGPLGGIYTALKTTKAKAVLFLACDMPLVSSELIQFVLRKVGTDFPGPLFIRSRGRAGFPFVLPCSSVGTVSEQIGIGKLSLQGLAKVLRARIIAVRRPFSHQLFNVNTFEDWAAVQTEDGIR